MPNYLNKPLSSNFEQTYVSQFVPLPLAQFARANERDQAQQDAQVQQAESVSDQLWKVNGTTKDDQAYSAELRNKYDEAATALTSKNLTQKENQDAVKDLIKGTSRDPSLQLIMSNSAIAAEHAKLKDEHQKAGTYNPANDMFDASYADYAKKGGYKSGQSLDSTIYKYEDGRPTRSRFFDDITKLGFETIKHIGDQWYKDGIEGISADRIGAQATAAINEYRATPAAAQSAREYAYKVRNTNPKYLTKNGELMDAKGEPLSSDKYVVDEFINAGMERAGLSYTTGRAAAKTADAKDKKEAENLFAGMESTESPSSLNGGRKLNFDSTGNMKGSGGSIVDHYKKTGFSWDTFTNWKNDTSQSTDEQKDWHYINAGAKLNKVTPEQYAKVYDTTWHPIVPKPLIGKALEDNNNVFRKAGSGVWSNIQLNNVATGEKGLNFIDAINKLAKEKGFDVPDANKKPKEYNELLDNLGVRVTGSYAPNRNSPRSIEIKIGGNTFAGDLTNGGSYMKGVTQEQIDTSNLDKLNGGEQVIEKDSKGNDVIYYKDIKTGTVKHKFVKDLK